MMHKYKVGDIVRIRQDYLPSAYADQFAEVVVIRDDVCQVRFYIDDVSTTEVIQVDDISWYVDDAVVSSRIHGLYIWGDSSNIDLAQFRAGSCAIAVSEHDVSSFLDFCDATNIAWSDGVQATKFNPYVEYDKLGAAGALHCLLCGTEVPSDYCIFAMTKHGLSFLFSKSISNCIIDSRNKD